MPPHNRRRSSSNRSKGIGRSLLNAECSRDGRGCEGSGERSRVAIDEGAAKRVIRACRVEECNGGAVLRQAWVCPLQEMLRGFAPNCGCGVRAIAARPANLDEMVKEKIMDEISLFCVQSQIPNVFSYVKPTATFLMCLRYPGRILERIHIKDL